MGNEVSGPTGEDPIAGTIVDQWNDPHVNADMVNPIDPDMVISPDHNQTPMNIFDFNSYPSQPPLLHQLLADEQQQQLISLSYQLNEMKDPIFPLPPSLPPTQTTVNYAPSVVPQPIAPTPTAPSTQRTQLHTTGDFLGSVIEAAQHSAGSSGLLVQHIATLKEQFLSIQEITKRHEKQRLETAERLRQELQTADVPMGESANLDPFDALIQAHRNKRSRVDEHGLVPNTPYPASTMGQQLSIDEDTLPPPFASIDPRLQPQPQRSVLEPNSSQPSAAQVGLGHYVGPVPPAPVPAASAESRQPKLISHFSADSVLAPASSQQPRPRNLPRHPSSTSPQQQSSGSSVSSDGSSGGRRSITLMGPKIENTAELSKVLLHNYVTNNILGRLEHEYETGQISSDAVKQHAMMIAGELEPDDQDELLLQFNRMSVTSKESSIIKKYTVETTTPTTPSTASSPSEMDSSNPSNPGSSPPTMTTTKFRQDMPVFGDQLLLTEPRPDDADGVARIRMILLYSPLERGANQHQSSKKRKKETAAADRLAASVTRTTNSSANPQSTTTKTAPITPEMIVHRMVQINHAYQRLIGYSQLEAGELFRNDGHRFIFKRTRSDHVAAYHQILTSFRLNLNQTNECVMYLVMLDKSGGEVYCLVHIRLAEERGVMLEGVQSLMPLPTDDPYRPAPPFIPGVDLDVNTLLYGYKPPSPNATDSNPVVDASV